MIYREYGKTGKKVSTLGFGGMRFEEIDNREKCVETMLEAAKAGVNYFDTAPLYFGTKSEEVFGEAFDEMRRQGLPFYCATKTFAADESSIRTEIEAQLKRLRVDAIDFYHVWCITSLEIYNDRKRQGVLETFAKLKDEGLIKHICVSSHLPGDDINELLREEIFEGILFGYAGSNFKYRETAFKAIAERNLGCVVMNPLGGGLIPQAPKFFEFLKTQENETTVEAAIRFLIAHQQITTALVGFQNVEHVREGVRAMEGYKEISAEELQEIKDSCGESFDGLCTGCGYCLPCPSALSIPKYMDTYNYKMMYGTDEAGADRAWVPWGVDLNQAADCIECGQCEDRCTQHLPIIERMKDLASLKAREEARKA